MARPLSRHGGSRFLSIGPTARNVVLPTLVVGLVSRWLWTQFGVDLTYSPRRVIHGKSTLIEAVVAPWMFPTSIPDSLSRLIQAAILCILPEASVPHLWGFWFLVALIRIPVGFIFTRSVGWAHPAFFSHYSLYETSAGFGPSVLALVALNPALAKDIVPTKHLPWISFTVPVLAAAFAWLENRAWTYGIALTLIFVMALISRIPPLYKLVDWLYPTIKVMDTAQLRTSEKTAILNGPGLPSPYQQKSTRMPSMFLPVLASLAILIPFFFVPTKRLPFPTASSNHPLLHVLMLSFPRPGTEVSERLLTTTLDSFVPHISPAVSMSVFTHSDRHTAMERIEGRYPNISFFVDRDSHPEEVDGHYLHLSEAFRWAEGSPAEWVMLIEDDFPICPGGWEVIATTMNMLEEDRLKGVIRAGFIGTGGSGIIFHYSYLDLLQVALRAYSSAESPIPHGVHRRAPDIVVQDCILGRPDSLCERHEGKVIISSRLVLDHIGGMATTTAGKALNQDKWRCGWRHAFHGDEAVEVVVV